MSNSLAVAAVTATLQSVLDGALGSAAVEHPQGIQGAKIFTQRPGGPHAGATAGADVFLYRVSPNPALRNHDLPTRNEAGRLVDRPTAALLLRYLVACFGDQASQEPEQVLGAVTAYLHANPVLTPAMIQAATASGQFPFLADADLGRAIEPVRLTPVPLSDEDLNRIWSMLPSGTFALSAVFEASVVLVERPVWPAEALPVLQRGGGVFPVHSPVVSAVVRNNAPRTALIRAGDTLDLFGDRLLASSWAIEVDGVPVPAAAIVEETPRRITFTLPAATPSGPRVLRMVHELGGGPPPATVFTAESNPVVVLVHPVVTAVARVGTEVRVDVATPAGATQRLEVILNQQGGAQSFVLPGTRATPTRITSDVTGLPAGTYLVRARIDGVSSEPVPGAGGVLDTPSVVI